MNQLGFRRRAALSSVFSTFSAGCVAVVLGAGACSPNISFEIGCQDGLTKCGSECVDLQSDPASCGACGIACGDGVACVAGVCDENSCDPGLVVCAGACVDLGSDPDHCGGCFMACPPGAACNDGHCEDSCGDGLTNCSGACVDTTSDPANCGGCGEACPPGSACSSSACQCPPGETSCGGACVNLSVDEQHCGGCSTSCDPGATCVNGMCQDACGPDLEFCNGVCVDTQTDPGNCGGCDNHCDPGEPCQGGVCLACDDVICGICNVQVLPSMVPQAASGSTAGVSNHFDPSCAPDGSGESAYSYTAPADGTYIFDTAGSGYDTVLALLGGASCGEVACNDDSMGPQSKIQTTLTAGQTVIVVVDGWNGQEGAYQLHVSTLAPSMCPDADIGSMVPQTLTGTTVNAGDDVQSPCGQATGSDISYQFTAPAASTYHFDTFGSSFDTILHVHDGGCGGASLGCNDDTMGLQSSLSIPLVAGQTVVVVVDGFGGAAGNFTLHIIDENM
jgi:hypothetical protein